jgi:cell division protein FtsX
MQKKIFSSFCLAAAVGGLATLACAVSRGLTQAQENVRAALPVTVFFQANSPDDQSRSVSDALKKQDPAIETVSYLSKEQAYAEASKDPLLSRSLMLLHDNPLSAVTELHYSRQAWLERQDPAQALHGVPGVQDIRWSASRRDAFLAFEPWKKIIGKSLWVISIALCLWALSGIHTFALTLTEWRRGFLFFLTGTLGAASTLGVWSLIIPGQPYPLLPVLFGGLIGIGAYPQKSL